MRPNWLRCAPLLALVIPVTTPSAALAQDAPTLLGAARAQIEEFAYDSAHKLLVRLLNASGQLPAVLVRANTLYAINELNRLSDGKLAARGAFLEALRLDPRLVIDTLAHLHSDATAVFAEALDLAPTTIKNTRASGPVAPRPSAANPPRAPARSAPAGVPAYLPARIVRLPERISLPDWGFYDETPNLLDQPCSAFLGLFWDVLGFEIDSPRLCTLSAVLVVQSKGRAQSFINYTRITRRKDGSIEADIHPAAVAEWFNEVTGKRLQFNVRGDTVLVTDLTPSIALTRMPPRKVDAVVNTRTVTVDSAQHYIAVFESHGAPVADVRDALPMELSVAHPHRAGSCQGTLSFDGDQFRYVSMQSGGHAFRFTIDDVLMGSVAQEVGTLRTRTTGGEERFVVSAGWNTLLSAIVKSRRR